MFSRSSLGGIKQQDVLTEPIGRGGTEQPEDVMALNNLGGLQQLDVLTEPIGRGGTEQLEEVMALTNLGGLKQPDVLTKQKVEVMKRSHLEPLNQPHKDTQQR